MDEEHKRMCWASRRGMLELDLILEPFVKNHYADLDADGRASYRALMACQDQELFGWFLRREEPADAALGAMVKRILETARSDRSTR